MFKPKDSKFLEYYTKMTVYKLYKITSTLKLGWFGELYFIYYNHFLLSQITYNDIVFLKAFENFLHKIIKEDPSYQDEIKAFVDFQVDERYLSILMEAERDISKIDDWIQIYSRAAEQEEFPISNEILFKTIEQLEKYKEGQHYCIDEEQFLTIYQNSIQYIIKKVAEYYENHINFFIQDKEQIKIFMEDAQNNFETLISDNRFFRELKKDGDKQYFFSFILDDEPIKKESISIYKNFSNAAIKGLTLELIFHFFDKHKIDDDQCISKIYKYSLKKIHKNFSHITAVIMGHELHLNEKQTCNFAQHLRKKDKIKRSSCKNNFYKIGNLFYNYDITDKYFVNFDRKNFISFFNRVKIKLRFKYWEKFENYDFDKAPIHYIESCLEMDKSQITTNRYVTEEDFHTFFDSFYECLQKFIDRYNINEDDYLVE